MKNELREAPVWVLILAAVLVIAQGSWLFISARRRGLGRMAWFWGIWGSTSMPLPLVLFWFIVIRPSHKKS